MTPEQYAAAQAAISAATARYVTQFGRSLLVPGMTLRDWLGLLEFLWPEVLRQRERSAVLARTFYDAQRVEFHPDLSRNDRLVEGSDFKVFVRSMEPARKKVQEVLRVDPDMGRSTDKMAQFLNEVETKRETAATYVALQTVREVENAGRRQIINAVLDDDELEEKILSQQDSPDAELVRGWARVATGNETCAWCLMLISRGPVYLGANTAGLDLDDESAVEMIAAGEDVSDYMDEWHTGCDCKVVPVFKISEWSGREAWKRAEELWKDATKEARRVLEDNPDKVHFAGKHKGEPVTLNDEAINSLRRRLERGEIDMTEFAALAA